jgi:2-hydroxychromene-2-carboxylate isomerase
VTIADWYFDFVSPFSYLQCERLPALAPALQVRCKPVVFGAILAANSHKGPAEIPGKRGFTYRYAHWQAGKLGIPFRFPHEHPFNPLPLLRLAVACDSRYDAVQRIFRFVWRDGRLPDLPIEWAELAQQLGVHNPDARIDAPEVKDELRHNTDEAIARGVFGVPTLAIGGELFWGADATDMAREYVAQGCRYTDPEYARISALPTGVVRKASNTGKP